MHRAVREGLERKRIVIDPGLGFGKRKEQNSEILGRLDELAILDLPIMVGPSRKHFLAREAAIETEFASAAAVAAAVLYGAHIVRVHDVRTMKAVVEVADEIARARAAQEALRQETAKQESARQKQGGRSDARETRSAGGPREARPPGSRAQEGKSQYAGSSSRFDDRRETRPTPRFAGAESGESRKPLRPPASKPPVFRPTASHSELTASPSTSLGMTGSSDRTWEDADDGGRAGTVETELDSKVSATLVAQPVEDSQTREAPSPISAPPAKPFYSRPAAAGKSRSSKFDNRRESRPDKRFGAKPFTKPRDSGLREDRPSASRPPDSRSRDSRDSRSDDRRDSRGGPRQGSYGRPPGPFKSGPPRSERSFSGPRSERPSGPRSDRPAGPPRSGRPSSGPPRSGKPFRPAGGRPPNRRPPGRG